LFSARNYFIKTDWATEKRRLIVTIDERIELLITLNMLAHTRENEMEIGNHLIAVREYIKEQEGKGIGNKGKEKGEDK